MKQQTTNSTALKTAIAFGFGALVAYVIISAMSATGPTKHIEAYNNTIINIGGVTNLTSEGSSPILGSSQ